MQTSKYIAIAANLLLKYEIIQCQPSIYVYDFPYFIEYKNLFKHFINRYILWMYTLYQSF